MLLSCRREREKRERERERERERWLVAALSLVNQSTTRDYIRAEEDFHEEIYS